MAEPVGSFAASVAIDAVTSADITLSMASRSAASAPNHGAIARGASMNPIPKRSGLTSALSQDSQEVTPGDRAAAQPVVFGRMQHDPESGVTPGE